MRFALGVLVACGTAAPPPPAPEVPQDPLGATASDALVTGRVLLDNKPVTLFGVVITKQSLGWWPGTRAITVRAKNGRFRFRWPVGTVDIVIAGPKFTRRLIPRQVLTRGGTVNLRDIDVTRGFTIDGQVTDPSGTPVAGATISIEQTPGAPTNGSLTGLAFGNTLGITDANGRYSIPGVAMVDPSRPPWIYTFRAGSGASYSQRVPLQNATVNLRLEPAGTIDGTVDTGAFLTLQPAAPQVIWRFIESKDGKFRIDHVPAGVHTLRWESHTKQVTVAPNSTTQVTLP